MPLYSIPHQEECYAFVLLDYGLEDYVYFLIALEKTGELWVLPSKDLRASKSITAGRPQINKEAISSYLQRGDPNVHPYKPDKPND